MLRIVLVLGLGLTSACRAHSRPALVEATPRTAARWHFPDTSCDQLSGIVVSDPEAGHWLVITPPEHAVTVEVGDRICVEKLTVAGAINRRCLSADGPTGARKVCFGQAAGSALGDYPVESETLMPRRRTGSH